MPQIETQLLEYKDETGKVFEAFVAHDASQNSPRPVVLVFHAFAGRTKFENERARKLAEMGYVGFAADVYGKGVGGSNRDENMKLMKPLIDDRPGILFQRLKASVETAKKLPYVDSKKVAAIGFCFGGLCVLDIARHRISDVLGAVSIHGALIKIPSDESKEKIHSKVLALHGYADPHVPPEHVTSFAKEMTDRQADWQLHAYGNVLHGFTHPGVNEPERGVKYDADADRRSNEAMRYFLEECFS